MNNVGRGRSQNPYSLFHSINLNTPNAIKLASKTIKVPQVEGDATIEIPFFVSRSVLPSSSKIEGVAAYTSPGGAPRTTWVVCAYGDGDGDDDDEDEEDEEAEFIEIAELQHAPLLDMQAVALQPELKDTGEKVLSLKFFAGY
eukprot:jgi/Bigna1/139768/aug1.52_g14476